MRAGAFRAVAMVLSTAVAIVCGLEVGGVNGAAVATLVVVFACIVGAGVERWYFTPTEAEVDR